MILHNANNTSITTISSVSIGNNSISVSHGQVVRVSFTASTTGTYIFTSTGSKDTCGFLYPAIESSNALATDDDSGTDHNFRLEYTMNANQIIYIGVKYYSADENGIINLNISRKANSSHSPSPTPQLSTVNTGSNRISVRAGHISRVKFVAPSNGTYVFSSTGSDDTFGYLYSTATSSTEIRSDDDSGNDHNFRIEYTMSANQSIYVGVKYYSEDKSGTINLNISRRTNSTPAPSPTPQISTVSTGTSRITVRAGQTSRVKFTAPSSGTYVFTSTGSDDTYGYLYNSSTSTTAIVSDDDNGTNNNFRIEYSLSSNQSVYIGVKYYSSDKSGTITLTITKQSTSRKPWPVGSTCRVVVGSGNARAGAGTDYGVSGTVYEGNEFTILDYQLGNTGKDWYKINLRGTVCWISSGLVEVGGHRDGTINGVPIN